jgi:hypothetical protein
LSREAKRIELGLILGAGLEIKFRIINMEIEPMFERQDRKMNGVRKSVILDLE